MRKIVQVATLVTGDFANVMALCDDGTLWEWHFESRRWQELPNVPQPKEEE